jgi:cytochrome c-type biogenesis protein
MVTDPSVIAVFFAGMISFFSPCVLPLVPAYLSMVTGVSVTQIQEGAKGTRLRVLRGTSLFMAGFTVVFMLLGISASAIGGFLRANQDIFNLISGIIIIVFGILLIGFIRPGFLEQERRFRVGSKMGTWGAPLMGVAFAFGWTPCIGPILGAVLTFAATEGTVTKGALLLFVYSLGLGIPFLITGLLMSEVSSVFGWVKRHFRAINVTAGTILVIFGLLMITGNVTRISTWLVDRMEDLGINTVL